MRFKTLVFGAMIAVFANTAHAGSCSQTAHCYTHENGVHVLRGQHSPVVSQQAIAYQKEQNRLAQQAKELEAVKRLNASIRAQNAEIAALRTQVSQLENSRTQRPRRRVYYGNPAFFGRNGFIGNRYYGGATTQLPRRHKPH